MFLLVLASVVGLAFIIERGLALRWSKVIPPYVKTTAENCKTREDLPRLTQSCTANPSPTSRLLLLAKDNLMNPREAIVELVQTRARQEVVRLERGLVILEIVVGIAPLLGLVGTIHGLITLFGDLGKTGVADNAVLAKGIAIALNTTLMGLLVAIPSLVAWSYYNKKVETMAVEMEGVLDQFVRQQAEQKKV
ncbi:MAG: MotA/TolQ/ExbB proton channel family protein [Verrucomicrobiota bacterium]|nr:MotA/TolQ/ExbB proton channel family protein [Verrucomicrobiota bacterium]